MRRRSAFALLTLSALGVSALGAVVAACAGNSPATVVAVPLTLIAERIEPGNPPLRTFVVLRDDGSPETRIRWRLKTGTSPLGLSTSRDGTRLFASITRSYATSRATNIFSFKPDGSDRQLVAMAGSGAIALSPDARLIAYVRSPSRVTYSSQLWTMHSDGSDQRLLVRGDRDFLDFPGSWAPDGQSLAFTRCRLPAENRRDFENHCAVWVIGRDGTRLRRVAESALLPDWSPDGTRIAFVSARDRTHLVTADSDSDRWAAEIYVMHADGTHQRRLTTTRRLDESLPRWSPGGTRIAYTRRGQAFTTRLFEINADGTCTTAITRVHGDTSYELPSWLPTGRSHEQPLTCR